MAQSPQEQKAIVQRMIDAGESEENIATVIQHFKNSAPPQDNRPGWLKFIAPGAEAASKSGPLAQAARGGIVQSPMSTLLSLAPLANKYALSSSARLPEPAVSAIVDAVATPHTPIEAGGKFAGDVAQAFVPLSRAATVAKPIHRMAVGAERFLTGMGKEASELALKERIGIATPENARKLYAKIVASEAKPVSPTGVVNYPTPPGALTRLRPDSWEFKQAARRAGFKSLASTAAAQGLDIAAPAIEQTAGGVGALLAGYLKSLFGGGSE